MYIQSICMSTNDCGELQGTRTLVTIISTLKFPIKVYLCQPQNLRQYKVEGFPYWSIRRNNKQEYDRLE